MVHWSGGFCSLIVIAWLGDWKSKSSPYVRKPGAITWTRNFPKGIPLIWAFPSSCVLSSIPSAFCLPCLSTGCKTISALRTGLPFESLTTRNSSEADFEPAKASPAMAATTATRAKNASGPFARILFGSIIDSLYKRTGCFRISYFVTYCYKYAPYADCRRDSPQFSYLLIFQCLMRRVPDVELRLLSYLV